MRGVADTIYQADTAFSDFLYRAAFGQPPPDQVQAIANDAYNGVIKAGGTPAQAQAAANLSTGVATAGGTSDSSLLLLAGLAVGAIVLIKLL